MGVSKMRTLRSLIFSTLYWEVALHLPLLALAQPSEFTSFNCGGNQNEIFVDSDTNITYISDSLLMEFGEIKSVNSSYTDRAPKYLWTLRTFPMGNKTCYALPMKAESKYLLRTSFFYGNYDGSASSPQFDIYLENTFVQTVHTNMSYWQAYEFIVKPTKSYLTICLCKTNEVDNPFISAIELRPIPDEIYPVVNATLVLNMLRRRNFGASKQEFVRDYCSAGTSYSDADKIYKLFIRNMTIHRYPDDVFDRFWYPDDVSDRSRYSTGSSGLVSINTTKNVSLQNDPYKPPLKVMQTADIDTEKPYEIRWNASVPQGSSLFMCIHFAELKNQTLKETGQINITVNQAYFTGPITPSYLKATSVCSTDIYGPQDVNDLLLTQTGPSNLSPILNAAEVYGVVQLSSLETNDGDVNSLLDIKKKYGIIKPWSGDPCLPLNYAWEGLVCSNDSTSPLRVISLDLSNSGMSGEIPTSLTDLTALRFLNLEDNNLTGSIPDFLANLTQLTELRMAGNTLTGSIPVFLANLTQLRLLDLSDNNLSGTVPAALLRKKHDGNILLRISGNDQLCSTGVCDIPQRKNSLVVKIGLCVLAAMLSLLVVSLIVVIRTKKVKLAAPFNTPNAV